MQRTRQFRRGPGRLAGAALTAAAAAAKHASGDTSPIDTSPIDTIAGADTGLSGSVGIALAG